MSTKPRYSICLLICALVLVPVHVFGAPKSEDPSESTEEAKDRALVLFNYEEYIGSKTIKKFEKATGIKVEEVFFEDEEDALGALQSAPLRYDLVVISGDTIKEMIDAKTILPLDHGKIPNISNIGGEHFDNYYDPGLRHSVPFTWGTTGIVVNRDFITSEKQSWDILWDPAYRGKIALLNSPFEVAAAALFTLGYSINTEDPAELEEARKFLVARKSAFHGYYDDIELQKLMRSGEIWAAQIYNGEGMILADVDEKFEFFIPEEGAAQWVDSFVIPRRAQNVDAAYEFLDFILEPELNASIVSELWYATPVQAAIPLMDEEVREAPEVFPTADILARCEYFNITGEATRVISRLWSDLQIRE